MTISLTKTLTDAQALLIASGRTDAAMMIPEVRATLAYPADHPLGKINAEFELRTTFAQDIGYTSPIVPAGTFRSRLDEVTALLQPMNTL